MLIINIGELQQQQQQAYITLTVLTGLHGNPSSHLYPFLLIIPARENLNNGKKWEEKITTQFSMEQRSTYWHMISFSTLFVINVNKSFIHEFFGIFWGKYILKMLMDV